MSNRTDPLAGLGLRVPPANLEAEQALLGALLASNRAFDRVSDILKPEHFADAVHGRIYRDIARLIDQGRPVSAVTLKAEYDNAGALEEVGGAAYLAQLVAAMVGIVNVGEYAAVIRDCWVRRQLVDLGEQVVNAAHDPEGVAAAAQIEKAEEVLFALGSQGGAARPLLPIGDAVSDAIGAAEEAARRGDGLVGVTTGYAALDRMTAGWRKGQLIVLAGRPSMGKTAIAVGCAARAAAAGHRVLFISIEMPAVELAGRLVAAVAGFDSQVMVRGRMPAEDGRGDGDGFRALTQGEARRLVDAQAEIAKLPLMIDDAPTASVAAIRTAARRAMRKGGVDLLVVDYLGKVQATDETRRMHSRVHEVSEIARDMKATAKALGIPVLLLSQLNRGVEAREDKRPGMSDLRDSGEIEQEADVVLFLHREHYYLARSRPVRTGKEKSEQFEERERQWHEAVLREQGRAEVIIAKQRGGRIGPCRLRFADALTWFTDESEHGGYSDAIPHALGPQRRMGA
ncbi:replicative DNA helicase [Elioraea sp.]|uniref:replicative DNA helicase n=1 Tax=Elioraea sp. TaxID=2185103 RepID=UPI0025C4BE6D|nr:replicative DNA helicase [Elioraea sp.]